MTPPLPAAGYQLPIAVNDPTDAANLAVRMENDAAVAWRAVLEQADPSRRRRDRAFAVSALTQCAVLAARWKQVLGVAGDPGLPRRHRLSSSQPDRSAAAIVRGRRVDRRSPGSRR